MKVQGMDLGVSPAPSKDSTFRYFIPTLNPLRRYFVPTTFGLRTALSARKEGRGKAASFNRADPLLPFQGNVSSW